MRHICLLLFVLFLLSTSVKSEGTRQLAPNGSITIGANTTTDLAALFIDSDLFNNFASYTNPDPNSRLFINIQDPLAECIYLGFSFGHANVTSQNPPQVDYEYRVVDPNGNVVFGPVTVSEGNHNINSWSEASIGPMQLNGAGGYNALQVSSANLTSQGWTGAGDFYIEFRNRETGGELLIDFWDITVVNCSALPGTEKLGRVWSYNWAFFAVNDFGFPNRPFNGSFFVCAPDPENPSSAFVTKIDFNGSGFQPAAFNVAFNSFGSQNTGDVMADRRSVENTNATSPEYAIFLNDPVDICETASPGAIELEGVSRCDGGGICIKLKASKEGQIDLLLDFDGPDDIYTPGSADVMIVVMISAEEAGVSTCIDWDGLDGLGNPISASASSQIPVFISFAQGIYHFPVFDAELMLNGFSISAVRPTGDVPLLYYDDSNISVPSGSGEPDIQFTGCVLPCHRWTNFVNNGVPGFGNLHTINSWWFSQSKVRKEVFFFPTFLECSIEGPTDLCQGRTAQLSASLQVIPVDAEIPTIISKLWEGPEIVGAADGEEIEISLGGTYTFNVEYLSSAGDTCITTCQFTVETLPTTFGTIDTLIQSGVTITINGTDYSDAGQYEQTLVATNGCDSFLIINIYQLQTSVLYDLDACASYAEDGSDTSYVEFTASYPDPLSCAEMTADFLFRENPAVNKHSCTPGVNDSPAMCISSLDACDYAAGDEKSAIFELTVVPAPDTAVRVTSVSFFEKAPETFNWIDGASGPNNYPTLFGIRVMANGVEIFREEDRPTSTVWTKEDFFFGNVEGFTILDSTTFRFELLGYCLIGNGAEVTAWDLDEISIEAACISKAFTNRTISGKIVTEASIELPGVNVWLEEYSSISNLTLTKTNEDGQFLFPDNPFGVSYELKGYKNDDFLNGVSTLDLILIQKHLMGIEPFESPYQMIAADANKSNSLTALDLLELRKLILGINHELPRNTSWRFGIADQSLNISNPWDIIESIMIESLRSDIDDANFIGIKIGDVNGDVGLTPIEGRSDEGIILEFNEQWVSAGEIYTIPISSQNFNDVSGFQFALKSESLIFNDISNGQLSFSEGMVAQLSENDVRISWTDVDTYSSEDSEVLFSISVEVQKSGYLSDLLSLNSKVLNAQAYLGEELEVLPIQLSFLENAKPSVANSFIQVSPNPFSDLTTINFQSEQTGPIALTFFDLSGQILYRLEEVRPAGNHSIDISRNDLGVNRGVVIGRLEKGGEVISFKLVLME